MRPADAPDPVDTGEISLKIRHRLIRVCASVALVTALSVGAGAAKSAKSTSQTPRLPQPSAAFFNLIDFGAVGDGEADDGPALQAALDALAEAGGGTLFVPAGRYAIVTPVTKEFGGLASPVTISGVESRTPAPSLDADGEHLTHGLDLKSTFLPRTGDQTAIYLAGLQSLTVHDLAFVGTSGVETDAVFTLYLRDVADATVRHSEFYGLSSVFGAVLQAERSRLKVAQTVFLGCATNSGVYGSVIQNLEWKGIEVGDTTFTDYGQRPELYGKLDVVAPFSWIGVGNAAVTDNEDPRREAVFRNVFFDEGGLSGISSIPGRYLPASAPIDLLYVSGLRMNVSNLNTSGLYLTGLRGAFVENGFFGWSHMTDSAINILGTGSAIFDRIQCAESVTRIRADGTTERLAVIDTNCADITSDAQLTRSFNPATPDEDPAVYVGTQFQNALGRVPDAAAHFYWSDRILRCGDDAACLTTTRAALAAYLASAPSPTFTLDGLASDENGDPLAGVAVNLTGSQSATTLTDASGLYHFSNLPTSGVYAVAASKQHYTFAQPEQAVVTPAGGQTVAFDASLDRFAIGGRLTDAGGRGVSGVTVTLSGSQGATTQTDAGGNYTFAGVGAGGDYTVTPSSARFTFAPASQTFGDLGSNLNASFNATPLFHNITGRVINSNNHGIEAVTITLSGSQARTTQTDADGNFSFADLPRGGNYTVTPSGTGFVFGPASQTFNNLSFDQGAVFVRDVGSYKLSGRVTEKGAGLGGVIVTLGGMQSAAMTTGADGAYSFTVAGTGNYTITPSKPHYTFTQTSATFNNLGADQTADFDAALIRHAISGRILRAGGSSGFQGVTVTLSGSQSATAQTDAGGGYTFAGVAGGGNYTVTPSKLNYTFSPAGATFNDLGADRTADFTGTPVSFTIGGRVTSGGAALSGVIVTLSGSQTATATTDASGGYAFTVPAGGNYTVTPSKPHYTFTQTSATFNNLGGNQTADFAATLKQHTLSGQVINSNNNGIGGVTITLSGSQTRTTQTDAGGNFSFTGVPAGGNYAVTPLLAGFAFSPASQTFGDLDADHSSVFVAGLAVYKLSGRVTEKGAGLGGVTVTLSGSHPLLGPSGAQVLTGADGGYSFNATAGGDYTVTPSKKGYTFDRAGASFNNLGGDRTADFAATQHAVIEFGAGSYSVGEGDGELVVTVTRGGDTSSEVTAIYQAQSGTAKRGSDFVTSIGMLVFAPGETSQTFAVFITDDSFVEGAEQFTLTLTPADGVLLGEHASATATINDNDTTASSVNPADDSVFYVRQHYRDFLNREPDAEGLAFWTGEINRCGADAQCRDVKRVNVSAAFFLSIEFQQTGYFVERLYKVAYGRTPRRVEEFMLDARVIGDGVVVGATGWEQKLEANKTAYAGSFADRAEFVQRYPKTQTPAQFVAALNANTGRALTAEEEARAASEFGGAPDTADRAARIRVLRLVAENQAFYDREFQPAFVLMQYFGYLRRNPDEAPDTNLDGYNFWLKKLADFGGDFQKAEMVKAFLSSDEYRGRFGK
ncbi:MAG: hypothetical protein QOJ76_3349 [Acidobacteriota bacterium]|nr:hypothetical protein [Acidobacteriota bacterium]